MQGIYPDGMPADSATLLDALRWRYATKAFDASRQIEAHTWNALEQSLVLTASSYGLQPWKFLVITDAAIRACPSRQSRGTPAGLEEPVLIARRYRQLNLFSRLDPSVFVFVTCLPIHHHHIRTSLFLFPKRSRSAAPSAYS